MDTRLVRSREERRNGDVLLGTFEAFPQGVPVINVGGEVYKHKRINCNQEDFFECPAYERTNRYCTAFSEGPIFPKCGKVEGR